MHKDAFTWGQETVTNRTEQNKWKGKRNKQTGHIGNGKQTGEAVWVMMNIGGRVKA